MAEEIALENGPISNIEGLKHLTLILDRVILHTVEHHSSTSTYMPNFIEIEETFCGRINVCMDLRTFEIGFIRSILLYSRPKNGSCDSDHTPFRCGLSYVGSDLI